MRRSFINTKIWITMLFVIASVGSTQFLAVAAESGDINKEKMLIELYWKLKKEDKVVCYVQEADVPITWTLNVKKHSPLVLTPKKEKEEKNSKYRKRGHKKEPQLEPTQATYSTIGKSAQPGQFEFENEILTMSSVNGSVVVHKEIGARIALTKKNLVSPLGTGLVTDVECTSPESSATPEEWFCVGINYPIDDNGGPQISNPFNFGLSRVDPSEASEEILEQCNYYEEFVS